MLPITSIIRQATRRPDEKYNVLVGITHERFESNLAKCNANFYAFPHQSFKPHWQTKFADIPENYHILAKPEIPRNIDFVLSGNRFGQFQVLSQIAKQLHLPLVSVEHTLPFTQWGPEQMEQLRNMRGYINVFISEYSIGQWGWQDKNDTHVVHHGLDSEEFKPGDGPRENRIMSVVNDWKNRDWCCGYHSWTRIINGLPFKVVGDNPGLSKPSDGTADLIKSYQESSIFLNTSTISPIPMSLMEAMSCGCAVVSTATCMIPEIIQNGVNGFLSNNESELRGYLELLLKDEDLRNELGSAARKTIMEKFGLDTFIGRWNTLFDVAANTPYRG